MSWKRRGRRQVIDDFEVYRGASRFYDVFRLIFAGLAA